MRLMKRSEDVEEGGKTTEVKLELTRVKVKNEKNPRILRPKRSNCPTVLFTVQIPSGRDASLFTLVW